MNSTVPIRPYHVQSFLFSASGGHWPARPLRSEEKLCGQLLVQTGSTWLAPSSFDDPGGWMGWSGFAGQ